MKYKEGDIVRVKIAGLEVSGIVKETKKTGEYVVQFDGGAESVIAERHMKPTDGNMSRNDILNSPSRRSPSKRSPARAASPARRAKGKSPSPARRKSPSRRSQARILKISLENLHIKADSPLDSSFPRRRRPIEHTTEVLTFHSVTAGLTGKRFEVNNGMEGGTVVDGVASETPVEPKVIHLTPHDYVPKGLGTYSDDEAMDPAPPAVAEKVRKSEPRLLRATREFGGWPGALALMFSMPAFVLALHVFCNKHHCSFGQVPVLQPYTSFHTYFDVQALLVYLGYMGLIVLLTKLPFGGRRVVSLPSNCKKQVYRMNGFFSVLVVHAVLAGLEWYGLPIINTLHDKYFQLLVTAILAAVTLASVAYVKSKFVPLSGLNTHGVTYNFVYDFFVGREVIPKLLGIDVKFVLLRSALIAVILMNSLYIFKSLTVSVSDEDTLRFDSISYDPALLVSGTLQIIYILDIFCFESTMLTSFELQSEGVGYYMCMSYALYPFTLTAVTKYLYEHEPPVCPWLLAAGCAVFFVGYVLFRGANSQKNAFRLNPFDPALAHLEAMPTSLGKKLLISGYWGLVRHPNYLGDILIYLAIGALCVPAPAALGTVPSTVLLLHRASRIDARCKRRYGSYWDRYCQKVRYQLIPKVY